MCVCACLCCLYSMCVSMRCLAVYLNACQGICVCMLFVSERDGESERERETPLLRCNICCCLRHCGVGISCPGSVLRAGHRAEQKLSGPADSTHGP